MRRFTVNTLQQSVVQRCTTTVSSSSSFCSKLMMPAVAHLPLPSTALRDASQHKRRRRRSASRKPPPSEVDDINTVLKRVVPLRKSRHSPPRPAPDGKSKTLVGFMEWMNGALGVREPSKDILGVYQHQVDSNEKKLKKAWLLALDKGLRKAGAKRMTVSDIREWNQHDAPAISPPPPR